MCEISFYDAVPKSCESTIIATNNEIITLIVGIKAAAHSKKATYTSYRLLYTLVHYQPN